MFGIFKAVLIGLLSVGGFLGVQFVSECKPCERRPAIVDVNPNESL